MFFYLWFVLVAVKAICDFQWLHVSHVECLINDSFMRQLCIDSLIF
jgi:hypothetical protein